MITDVVLAFFVGVGDTFLVGLPFSEIDGTAI